mgnify:CR=1 FL=1
MTPHKAILHIPAAELAQMRTRFSRRLAKFAIWALLLPTLGPVLLSWLAPAGMSAAGALWYVVTSMAAGISNAEVFLSQYPGQGAVFVGCCIAYLLILGVNQTLTCAELMVNPELTPKEKFDKALKGHLFFRKSMMWGWLAYGAAIGLTLVSLVYKLVMDPEFDDEGAASLILVMGLFALASALASPLFSWLIPQPLRAKVDLNVDSDSVRSAMNDLDASYWSEGQVGFFNYPSIYFYWLCKQEDMLDKWALVAGNSEAREKALAAEPK